MPVRGYLGALAAEGKRLYLGGSFDRVGGKRHPALAAIDLEANKVAPTFNAPRTLRRASFRYASVRSIAPRGARILVGGDVGVSRDHRPEGQAPHAVPQQGRRGARDDATVDYAFHSQVSGEVQTLVREGATLYVGGSISRRSGTRIVKLKPRKGKKRSRKIAMYRFNLVALDAGTGKLVKPFVPKANSEVSALALSSSALYLAGRFQLVDGRRRDGLAAVDPTTGKPASEFSPQPTAATAASPRCSPTAHGCTPAGTSRARPRAAGELRDVRHRRAAVMSARRARSRGRSGGRAGARRRAACRRRPASSTRASATAASPSGHSASALARRRSRSRPTGGSSSPATSGRGRRGRADRPHRVGRSRRPDVRGQRRADRQFGTGATPQRAGAVAVQANGAVLTAGVAGDKWALARCCRRASPTRSAAPPASRCATRRPAAARRTSSRPTRCPPCPRDRPRGRRARARRPDRRGRQRRRRQRRRHPERADRRGALRRHAACPIQRSGATASRCSSSASARRSGMRRPRRARSSGLRRRPDRDRRARERPRRRRPRVRRAARAERRASTPASRATGARSCSSAAHPRRGWRARRWRRSRCARRAPRGRGPRDGRRRQPRRAARGLHRRAARSTRRSPAAARPSRSSGDRTTPAPPASLARAIALATDGSAIVAGAATAGAVAARYDAAGALDCGYGTRGPDGGVRGCAFSPSTDGAIGAALQADGKLLVAGRPRAAVCCSGGCRGRAADRAAARRRRGSSRFSARYAGRGRGYAYGLVDGGCETVRRAVRDQGRGAGRLDARAADVRAVGPAGRLRAADGLADGGTYEVRLVASPQRGPRGTERTLRVAKPRGKVLTPRAASSGAAWPARTSAPRRRCLLAMSCRASIVVRAALVAGRIMRIGGSERTLRRGASARVTFVLGRTARARLKQRRIPRRTSSAGSARTCCTRA